LNRPTEADLILVGVVALWGTSFALVKEALTWTTPILFVILRFLLAGTIWLVLYRDRLAVIRPSTLLRGVVLGIVLGGGFVFQTIGLGLTSASLSGFITGLNVVVVPLLVVVIERRIPRPTSLVGVVICTVGLFVMTSPVGEGFGPGALLTLGCAVLFGLYIVLVEIYTREGDPRDLILTQTIGVLLVSLAVLPFAEAPRVVWNWSLIWHWLALGAMAAVTLALQLHWQRYISATRAAIIFTLEPPLATLFAFLLLGEVLSGAAYLGGALIFLGMLVAETGARVAPGRTFSESP
jgi:drug/metabolite transporter (DMT)-like permease